MAELSKTYDPKSVEPKWYVRWIDNHDFEADARSSKPAFSIVMPPPNITGVLTLGHVLNNTIQDILARRARMQGFEVLWLPGMDHAGIGTQAAVEKYLRKTENKTRHDLGREEFLRRVLEWQDKHGGIIIEQLKRLGCSCDWSRERYTLDDAYVAAVQNVFVDLYRKGLIYRGRRMISWDPAAQTAVSDEEVISKPQKGNLYFVRYEIVEEPGRFLEVATTRPETIMADTAMAFHPDDKRYADLLGKHAWRPLARKKLPIIADEAIDPEFGTGVLKVTPAHDTLDFEIGQRHNLPVVDVLYPDGKINCPAVPELDGLDRFEARKKAAELLEEKGLLSKTEAYENNVGFSQRSDVPIEPRISEQWFLRYPTSVLVTAPDIIFFWVARMIIAGLEFKPGKSDRAEENIPFRDVYFTGLIRDKEGRKMSKSLGNSPDPLELIDKYGADGLRFGLMRIAPRGQDIRFDERQIEEGRNFATKLWNVARFRQMQGLSSAEPKIDTEQLSIYATEVLARLNETIDAVEAAYREYQFNTVAQRLYDFVWSDYCDWFVEAAKTDIFSEDEATKKSALAVMDFVLSAVLRLLHPFMPHITEELWSLLGLGNGSIQFAVRLEKVALNQVADVPAKRQLVSAIYQAVQAGRNLRAESKLPSNKKIRVILRTDERSSFKEIPTLKRLLNADDVTLDPNYQASAGTPVAVTPLGEIFLAIPGGDKTRERERLDKEIARIESDAKAVEAKLESRSFLDRAPAAVVEEHRQRLKEFSAQLTKLKQAREALM